jgi:hypothetical protein
MPIVVARVIPTLRMFDVAKAREFYLDYLGFTVDFEHRFHDNAPLFMASRATAWCCISASITATAAPASTSLSR